MAEKTTRQRRPWWVTIIQSLVRWFFRILLTLGYRIRVHGLENYPKDDRLLICANHQSYLDPLVLGVVCPRPVNYLARRTLFKFYPLAVFLRFNDSIPIDRESNAIDGIKETLRRLKRDEAVVMFPEGTRSRDGELQPIMPGYYLLAKRSKATIVPIGIEGCFDAYPSGNWFPRLGNVHVVIGEPIPFEHYDELSSEETTALLSERLNEAFGEARRLWQRENVDSESTWDAKLLT